LGVPFFPGAVVTVTVAVELLVPLSVTEAGDTLQVPAGGVAEQLREIVPVNPLTGVRVSV